MEDDWVDIYLAITLRRARILKGLARAQSEREIAQDLCLTLAGVRSHVEDLKRITGLQSTRELARWWQIHASRWVVLCAREAGVPLAASSPRTPIIEQQAL
jgi:DNA-binding CsgD family transcriptional regulator